MPDVKLVGIRLFLILVFFIVLVFTAPPYAAEDSKEFVIHEGLTTSEVADILETENIIYSPFLFRVAVYAQGGNRSVKAGNYIFDTPVGVWKTARRLVEGEFGLSQIRVRVQEGSTREQMAEVLEEHLPSFDAGEFLQITRGKEGYLFPDTYFFFQDATARDVATRLENTFFERLGEFEALLEESSRSLEEIVILASIIEREAHDPTDQRLIAGVLENRLEIGMALQVDATLYYLLGKPSSELTQEDLDIDSPYNTYKYPGLPPGPISSPGLTALEAALDPTPSNYFYYLSDSEGVTHFAEDFEEHKQNKIRFLR